MSYKRFIKEIETTPEASAWWEMPAGLLIWAAIILSSALLISPAFANAAIARDTHATSGLVTNTGQTKSYTLATGAVLLVGIYTRGGNGSSSVTWNGTSMTQVCTFTSSYGFTGTMYFLGAPTSGTHNIVSTVSSSDNIIYAASYAGAQTTTPVSCTGAETAGSSVSITLSQANSAWFFGFADGSADTGGANAVQLDQGNSGFNVSYDSNGIANSTTMTVSRTGSGMSLVGMSFGISVATPYVPNTTICVNGYCFLQ